MWGNPSYVNFLFQDKQYFQKLKMDHKQIKWKERWKKLPLKRKSSQTTSLVSLTKNKGQEEQESSHRSSGEPHSRWYRQLMSMHWKRERITCSALILASLNSIEGIRKITSGITFNSITFSSILSWDICTVGGESCFEWSPVYHLFRWSRFLLVLSLSRKLHSRFRFDSRSRTVCRGSDTHSFIRWKSKD